MYGNQAAVIRLVQRFFTRRDYLILVGAVLAWTLRAIAGSVMFPLSVGTVVNHLNSGGQGLPFIALAFLVLALTINVSTEWVFRPYNYLFARKISEIRRFLAESIIKSNSRKESTGDLIGKLTSDIDFVMWNLSGIIATIMPSFLTAAFAVVTIAYTNLLMAGVSVVLLPSYILVVRKYSKDVVSIRTEERRSFSQIINLSSNLIDGKPDMPNYCDTLSSWNKTMYRQIFIDRVYWTYAWFFIGFGPIVLLALGAYFVNQSMLSVGNLVTVVLAANSVYGPIGNLAWGFAVLSQTVPPAHRIEESLEQNKQQLPE